MKNLQLNEAIDFSGWHSRAEIFRASGNKNEGGDYPIIITTEAPAEVVDWTRWEIVREILLMDGVILPEAKQVPFLDAHSRYQTADTIGAVRGFEKSGIDLLGNVNWWSGAKDQKSKVDEKIITDVSAGYRTFEKFTVILAPGEKKEINGKMYENNYGDGKNLFIRTQWELKEVSLVPIGADSAAKFKSELQPKLPAIKSEDPELQKKLDEALEENKTLKSKLNITNQRSIEMSETKAPELTPDQIMKQERERVREIEGIAAAPVSQKLFKGGKAELDKITQKAKDDGWSIEQFRQHVWGNLKNEDVIERPVTDLDMSPKEVAGLSISRAIEAMLDVRNGDVNGWAKHNAGAEKEAIDETLKRASAIPGIKLRGMPLPLDFFKNPEVMKHSNVLRAAHRNMMRDAGQLSKRASDGIGVSDATYLIGTQSMFTEFIDVLRNLGVAGPWGVRMVSGAKQNISVPKKTSTGTFHWVAESGTGTATDFVIGQLTATPHNGWASMKYTRQAALQSNPALDALIIDDILNNVITGRDLALLHGTNANNQPAGIDHTSGIGDVVGTSIDWEAIVEFWTDVKTNNINSSNLRFVTNALTAGILMTRPVVANQIQMLWDRLGQISAPPIVSEQVAANNLFFGDGSEAWMIDWGIIDLLVNPYKDDTGDVVITAFTALDILIARATAFSLADDVD